MHLKKNEKSTLDKISQKLSFTYTTIEEFKQKFINIKFSEGEKIKNILALLNIDIETYLKRTTSIYHRRTN